jgi:DNA-binding IclR family transcriptional regulator
MNVVSDVERDTIPTSLRMLMIIETIAREAEPMTPTAVNAHLGLPKPTIHRLFATLEAEGFVERHIDGRSYGAGPRLKGVAAGVISAQTHDLARRAVLRRLAPQIGEGCEISVPDPNGLRVIDHVPAAAALCVRSPSSGSDTLHRSAPGRILLASMSARQIDQYARAHGIGAAEGRGAEDLSLGRDLARVRRSGHAEDDEACERGVVGVAVPVRDGRGRTLCALSFHAPKLRMDIDAARAHVPALKRAAETLGALADPLGGG